MRERRRLQVSKDIAAIRVLQRQAAQRSAAAADVALREAEARCDASQEQLACFEQAWVDHMASPTLETGMAAAWAATILSEADELADLREAAQVSQADRHRSLETHRDSIAKDDAARDVVRTASRQFQRRHEEDLLTEIADRTAKRRAVQ